MSFVMLPDQLTDPGDFVITLDYQTGMPQVYPPRSKELRYDSLMDSPIFIFNPYGPQQLNLTRPNHRW